MGERVADRLDFEELALKSIDPSLGPTPVTPSASSLIPSSTSSSTKELGGPVKASLVISSQPNARHVFTPLQIPLLYPPSISTGPETLREISALASYRMPIHRRAFYLWAIAAPFTAPISIIRESPVHPVCVNKWTGIYIYSPYTQHSLYLLRVAVMVTL
jgi:hypothetical protein